MHQLNEEYQLKYYEISRQNYFLQGTLEKTQVIDKISGNVLPECFSGTFEEIIDKVLFYINDPDRLQKESEESVYEMYFNFRHSGNSHEDWIEKYREHYDEWFNDLKESDKNDIDSQKEAERLALSDESLNRLFKKYGPSSGRKLREEMDYDTDPTTGLPYD